MLYFLLIMRPISDRDDFRR